MTGTLSHHLTNTEDIQLAKYPFSILFSSSTAYFLVSCADQIQSKNYSLVHNQSTNNCRVVLDTPNRREGDVRWQPKKQVKKSVRRAAVRTGRPCPLHSHSCFITQTCTCNTHLRTAHAIHTYSKCVYKYNIIKFTAHRYLTLLWKHLF